MSGESSLLGRGTWFNPGPATLVVRPAGWILLVPGVKSSLIASAWRVLGEPPAADALLGGLASGSEFETEDRLPPVLFALGDGTSRTIGLTGTSPLAVYTAEGRSLLAGAEEGPAVITELADVRRIAFGDLPAEDPVAALRSVEGMSRVRGFVLMTTDPAELEEAARTQLAEQVEADGSSILDPAAKERAAQRKEARAKEKREREERRAQEASARVESSAASSSSRASSSSARSAAAEAPAGPSMFDDLFAPSADAQASPPQSDAAVSPARLPEAPPVTAPQAADAPEREPAAAAPVSTPTETAPAPSPAPEPVPAETAQAPGTAPAGTAAAHPPQSPAPGRSTRLVTSSLFDRRASRSGQRRTEGSTNRASQPSATPTSTVTGDGDGDQAPTPAEDPAADAAPVTRLEPIDPEGADPEAIDTDTDASAGTPEAGTSPSAGAAPPHTDPAPHSDSAVPAPPGEPGPAAPEADPPQVSARAAGASDLGAVIGEGGSAYDDLFGRTLHRSIEAAAVRAAGEDGGAEDGERASEATLDVESLDLDASGATGEETTSDGAPADPVGPDPAFATTEDVSLESTGDFIDWVPGMGRTAPEVAHASRTSERGGAERALAEHAPAAALPGIGRADARPGDAAPPRSATSAGSPALSPAQPTGQAPTAPAQAVTLPGAVCENRHANPPEATVCRWCGARIRGGVRTVARPPLGMIEISTGGRFLLDRSAIIGRRPRASRVSGDDVPQLITVPSPQQDISRSHVALRLEGWHVVAEDLRTTNGTTLLRSGEAPQRLRSGQSPVLADGDRLDLGDGVVLTLMGRPS